MVGPAVRLEYQTGSCQVVLFALLLWTVSVSGCAQRGQPSERPATQLARGAVVVAPVLNLSGATDLDPIKLTDALASEMVASSVAAVVPVNLTLAALARRGKAWIDTPQEAVAIAQEFGADGTVVAAVTEYDPYDPPTVGLVLQWYAVPGGGTSDSGGVHGAAAVTVQVQRVFCAADERVLAEVREYAKMRDGHDSPYGWRRYTKSQELFVRYCCWSAIRSMHRMSQSGRLAQAASEVAP